MRWLWERVIWRRQNVVVTQAIFYLLCISVAVPWSLSYELESSPFDDTLGGCFWAPRTPFDYVELSIFSLDTSGELLGRIRLGGRIARFLAGCFLVGLMALWMVGSRVGPERELTYRGRRRLVDR